MKRPYIVLIVFLVIILALPVYSWFSWRFQSRKPMNILILDKTVPSLDRTKHRSFSWILTNNRIVKPEKKTKYSYRKDYFGFHPLKPLREKQHDIKRVRLADIPTLSDTLDVAYYTDTYGVYYNDWYATLHKNRRSRMIYGGLNNNDYLVLKEMNDRDKLIIAEYNTIDYPTGALERAKTEALFDISWTGWTGKYFASLDTLVDPDFPAWITDMYRKQYMQPWTYKNGGIVLVKENKEVVVLEDEDELLMGRPVIFTEEKYQEAYNLPFKMAFSRWFDIVETDDENVVSEYRIMTSERGDSLLAVNFIPDKFPAIIKNVDSGNAYYFAGDFATNDIPAWTSRFKHPIDQFGFLFYDEVAQDDRAFFWLFYKPLMKSILNTYYDTVLATKEN